jgi:hypothetical protein
METEGGRKGLFMADNRKTHYERESVDTQNT